MWRSSSDDTPASKSNTFDCCLKEDSFAAHLRAECAEFHEIMSSHAVLHRVDSKHAALPAPLPSSTQASGTAETKQVLGGFASLGLAPSNDGPSCQLDDPQQRPSPGSEPSNPASASGSPTQTTTTPVKRPSPIPMDKWAFFSANPSDPLAILDVMSIDEMGQHSVDVGNVHEWQGTSLSAEIMCPLRAPRRTKAEWLVATSKKPKKRWVVVPGLNRDTFLELDAERRGYRTMIVTERPLWIDQDPEADAVAQSPSPFSGRAGYEFKVLRSEPGTCMPTLYLANPETHRIIHSFRNGTPRSAGAAISVPASPLASESSSNSQPAQSVYPVLRRSRSRPYLRAEPRPLRRSRSKPYMRYSQKHQNADLADSFAPSLPGPPGSQYQPDVSWPSARRAVSPGSASTRTSSGTNSSRSSLGPVATTCSHASTCGVSEAPSATSSGGKAAQAHPSAGSPDSDASQSSSFPGFPGSPFQTQTREDPDPLGTQGEKDENMSRSHVSSPSGPSPRHSISLQSESAPGESDDGSVRMSQEVLSPRISSSEAGYGDKVAIALTPASASESGMSQADMSVDSNRLKTGSSRSGPRKDRRLSEWFKRKVGIAQSMPQFAGMPGAPSLVYSPPSLATEQEELLEDSSMSASSASADGSKRTMALTRAALDQIDTLVDRAGSPESTIMGSRRGSEVVTQATVTEQQAGNGRARAISHSHREVGVSPPRPRSRYAADVGTRDRFGHGDKADRGRLTMEESRQAVATSLARIYGWSDDVVAMRGPREEDGVMDGKRRAPGSHFRNPAEMDSLLGMDKVAAEALTMLIPLPLLGRSRKAPATRRYLRVIFVPFDRPTPEREALYAASSTEASSLVWPTAQQVAGAQELQVGSGGVGGPGGPGGPGGGAPGASSAWYRKLGLNSISRNGSSTTTTTKRPTTKEAGELALATSASKRSMGLERCKAGADGRSGFQAFRVSGVVLEAPLKPGEEAEAAPVDARLPEPGTFPVVLGFCNGSHGIEMVSEGWTALGIVGEPELELSGENERLGAGRGRGPSPLAGVADVINAACAAIMGL